MLDLSSRNDVTGEITLARDIIHNPSEPRHFMKIKSVKNTVRIWASDDLIAQSNKVIRLLEVGYDLYDPVLYFPLDDICKELKVVEGMRTHCPIKGDAVYYDLTNQPSSETYLAWSYQETFEFAKSLQGLIAFNPERVSISEIRD